MLIYLCIVNVIAFILCFIDEEKTIDEEKILEELELYIGKKIDLEKTLLFFSFIGGCFMFYVGMYLFRHKTKHIKFKILVPLFILIWIYIILKRAF